jgi:hypothetical protein
VHRPNADHEQREAPRDEACCEHVEQRGRDPRIAPAAPEPVVPVERELERPEDERQRDRRGCERQEVARAAIRPVRPECAGDAEEQPADDEVRERPGDAAGGERPDRQVDAVARRVVEIGARVREDRRDPRQPHDQEDGLAPLGDRVGIVVAQRHDHRPRPLEHEQRAKPPVPHQET